MLGNQVERAKGIEPSYAAWEAAVLPLNYAREPLSASTQIWRSDGNEPDPSVSDFGAAFLRLHESNVRFMKRLKSIMKLSALEPPFQWSTIDAICLNWAP